MESVNELGYCEKIVRSVKGHAISQIGKDSEAVTSPRIGKAP
jgi:hypothetical protein